MVSLTACPSTGLLCCHYNNKNLLIFLSSPARASAEALDPIRHSGRILEEETTKQFTLIVLCPNPRRRSHSTNKSYCVYVGRFDRCPAARTPLRLSIDMYI
ncbi:hypothetical protein EVAR_47883_1 [Eumeta japonica]|uniref:Uncharacterized protein n=1 Tax=Eumeta variegata TaxID=151549 RepID=A0A4C1Y7Q6_EUMVA|nr:hypothetical protein EVAR_47883_1 [Eumeta japonica]